MRASHCIGVGCRLSMDREEEALRLGALHMEMEGLQEVCRLSK